MFDIASIKKTNTTKPPRLVVYGTPAVGKSTFASQAPDVVFMDIEQGLDGIESAKQAVQSYDEAVAFVTSLIQQEHGFKTLAIDSLDWLERLAQHAVVAEYNSDPSVKKIASVDEVPYGKGSGMVLEKLERITKGLDILREQKGMTIILIAHEKIKTFQDPAGANFDRYMLKLQDKAGAMFQEWADGVLFMRHKAVVTEKKEGFANVRKAHDAGVVMHTQDNPAFQAKNRASLSLPPEIFINRDTAWQDFTSAIGANKPKFQVSTPSFENDGE